MVLSGPYLSFYVYILTPQLEHEPLARSDCVLDSLEFQASRRVHFVEFKPLGI